MYSERRKLDTEKWKNVVIAEIDINGLWYVQKENKEKTHDFFVKIFENCYTNKLKFLFVCNETQYIRFDRLYDGILFWQLVTRLHKLNTSFCIVIYVFV